MLHKARICFVLRQSGKTIDVPVLCSRATQDLLVPQTAAEAISQIANDVTIRDITAPHFIFQLAASECAAAILQFERNISEQSVR
jgi:pimeloyl-ACP methyl ester carboxylesterase